MTLPHLYVIRHGETEWSLSGRYTGRTDIPLTKNGEVEARAVGHHLREIDFAHAFTSPRERAQRTGELVCPCRVSIIDPDLAEWDNGNYEGLFSSDILKNRPDWNLFQNGCPHGESPEQISNRADLLITRLRALEGNIALFTHGHFGRVLAARWIGLPVQEARHFLFDTACLGVLNYEHQNPQSPVIAQWNFSSELASSMVQDFDLEPPITEIATNRG
jgi:probable phosphoglycerate mutase